MQRTLEILRKVSFGLSLSLTGGLLLLLLLWKLTGETMWLLILFRYAPPVLYLALWFGITLVDVVLRRREALVPAVVSFAIVLVFFLGISLPLGKAGGEPAFRVGTYNIHAALGGAGKIGKFLHSTGCDIIGLQEARPAMVSPDYDPLPDMSAELPGMEVARGGLKGELVTFSRYPIRDSKEHSLNKFTRVLDLEIDMDGRAVRVMNVHCVMGNPDGLTRRGLEKSARARHEQAGALADLVRARNIPTVLVGDFNSPPNSVAHEILDEVMNDSFQLAGLGPGWSYPARLPLMRIDFIWVKGMECRQSGRLGGRLSDHRMVVSGLSVRK